MLIIIDHEIEVLIHEYNFRIHSKLNKFEFKNPKTKIFFVTSD
jgi:hypothetical protein